MNDSKLPAIKVGQNLWLDQIEEEHKDHPRIGEILAFCLMAFNGREISVARANEVVERALQIFPAQ